MSGNSLVEEEDIWGQILRESSNKTNYFETKHVVILGDPTSGKSLLLSKFNTITEVESLKSIALSYTFSDIYEDDTSEDPIGRINFWSLEGESTQNDLLKFALNKDNIKNSMIIITLDFSQPWSIVESLKKWLSVLEEQIKQIFKDDKNSFRELQNKLLIKWHEYVEPQNNIAGGGVASVNGGNSVPSMLASVQKKKKRRVNASTIEDTSVLPPLGENILINNLGVPILVACCKSDSVVMLEKDFSYKDELFDYIQQYLRRICLQYGAGLIYTSARKDINCDVALEYIENTLFGFELKAKNQLLEKDQIFVPAGWDTLGKITVDFENQKVCKDADEPYENIVKKPSIVKRREMNQVSAIVADEDQEYLIKIKNQLDNLPEDMTPSTPTQVPSSPTPVDPTSPTNQLRTSSSGVPPTGTQSQVAASPSAERAALANFFTSLISKDRTSSRKDLKSSLTSPPSSTPSARQDAQKELDKLKQQQKKII